MYVHTYIHVIVWFEHIGFCHLAERLRLGRGETGKDSIGVALIMFTYKCAYMCVLDKEFTHLLK